MINFNKYRGNILEKDGNFVNYQTTTGIMHYEIVEDYCRKNDYSTCSEQAIIENGNIYIRNANMGMFVIYMPSSITNEQLYQLEANDKIIDNFTYLGVVKDGKNYEYTNDIWHNFSNDIIQSYYKKIK